MTYCNVILQLETVFDDIVVIYIWMLILYFIIVISITIILNNITRLFYIGVNGAYYL